MKVQLFHGVGHENPDQHWLDSWADAITTGLQRYGYSGRPDFATPVLYDDLFEQHMEPTQEYLEAVFDLLKAWTLSPISGARAFGGQAPQARGLFEDIGNIFHGVSDFFKSVP